MHAAPAIANRRSRVPRFRLNGLVENHDLSPARPRASPRTVGGRSGGHREQETKRRLDPPSGPGPGAPAARFKASPTGETFISSRIV